jgi:transposase
MDQEGKRIGHQKLDCKLDCVEQFLKPYKRRLQNMAVESTFNWYWLVDGLRAAGYPVALANSAGIKQYNGIKHADWCQ